MMKIRNGMFETNSSSTHTIIVSDKNDDTRSVKGLSVDFAIGEFGWEFDKLDTPDEKASYLYTMACEILNRDVYQHFYEVLTKYGVNCTCSVPAEFERGESWTYLKNGYVDHASDCPEFVHAMMDHEHVLLRYLFSPKSFIITGNDNIWDDDEDPYAETLKNIDYPHTEYYKGN